MGDGLGLAGICLAFAALLIAAFFMLATVIAGVVLLMLSVGLFPYGGSATALTYVAPLFAIAAAALSASAIVAALRYLGGEDRASLAWAWSANVVLIAAATVATDGQWV